MSLKPKWIKKAVLLLCLASLTACGIGRLKNSYNLSFYSFHVESSKMTAYGAWKLPTHIPANATSPIYHYDIEEHMETYQLCFEVADISRYQAFLDIQGSEQEGCKQSLSVDKELSLLTYRYVRWNQPLIDPDPLPDLPFSDYTLATNP